MPRRGQGRSCYRFHHPVQISIRASNCLRAYRIEPARRHSASQIVLAIYRYAQKLYLAIYRRNPQMHFIKEEQPEKWRNFKLGSDLYQLQAWG